MTPRRIAQILLIIIALFIVWWFMAGSKSAKSESSFLNTRKGKDYCEKLCGGKSNKACLDDCKTKSGFYGCC